MAASRVPWLAVSVLIILHSLALFSEFLAPYGFETQSRLFAFAPPTRVHFLDRQNRFHIRPFIYSYKPNQNGPADYKEDYTTAYPIQFFVSGASYNLLGIFASSRHLFESRQGVPVFLLGTDEYGRDLLARLLYGGRISLFTGLLAATISVCLGTLLGGLAGYYGGWIDELMMRLTELFLTVPWLYLLLVVRASLPLRFSSQRIFFVLIALLGVIGWARPARLIRGVVLSAKNREYVLAARSFGASDIYLLRIHILPFASGIILTQILLYIPQYILAETTLSLLGLGVSEPVPSWGSMLSHLQQIFIFDLHWWLLTPAIALIVVFLAYYKISSFISVKRSTF